MLQNAASKNLVDDINKQEGEEFVVTYDQDKPAIDPKKVKQAIDNILNTDEKEIEIKLKAKKSEFEFIVSYFDFLEDYIPVSEPDDNEAGKNAVVTFAKQIKEQLDGN